jgi:signal transduction histidine kinase
MEIQGIVKDISERIQNERELGRRISSWPRRTPSSSRPSPHDPAREARFHRAARAGVAHEINNPLGFLKSNHGMIRKYIGKLRGTWETARASSLPLEEIEKASNSERIFADLDAIFQESGDGFARIMRIVGDLKNFARIDQGENFVLFDVNSGIRSTAVVARNEIKYVADLVENLGMFLRSEPGWRNKPGPSQHPRQCGTGDPIAETNGKRHDRNHDRRGQRERSHPRQRRRPRNP